MRTVIILSIFLCTIASNVVFAQKNLTTPHNRARAEQLHGSDLQAARLIIECADTLLTQYFTRRSISQIQYHHRRGGRRHQSRMTSVFYYQLSQRRGHGYGHHQKVKVIQITETSYRAQYGFHMIHQYNVNYLQAMPRFRQRVRIMHTNNLSVLTCNVLLNNLGKCREFKTGSDYNRLSIGQVYIQRLQNRTRFKVVGTKLVGGDIAQGNKTLYIDKIGIHKYRAWIVEAVTKHINTTIHTEQYIRPLVQQMQRWRQITQYNFYRTRPLSLSVTGKKDAIDRLECFATQEGRITRATIQPKWRNQQAVRSRIATLKQQGYVINIQYQRTTPLSITLTGSVKNIKMLKRLGNKGHNRRPHWRKK